MKKKFFAAIAIVLLWFVTNAQVAIDVKPYSFNQKNLDLLSICKSNKLILPAIDVTKLEEEDMIEQQNEIPPRFGFPHKVKVNLSSHGTWIDLDNGDRIWCMEIDCPSAKSINLLYDKFWLPHNATFHIYNIDKSHLIGAFTEKNNKGTKEHPGKFGTGLVYGEKILLEYYEPKDVKGMGIISISTVVQGYRYINILNSIENMESFGGSGACQVNINCSPEGDNWQDEKKSVAMILVNGNRWCSGSLINNVREDGIPYFLTANHCLCGWAVSDTIDAITNPDASDWSFYWNYESPTCTNGTNFVPPSTSGAVLVANNSNSDFALFRLTESPFEIYPSIQPYFSGWDRNTPGQGGVGIHHPAGDIKKISTHNITPTNYGNFWLFYWMETLNGFSVTEGGSSGSPLYNNLHRIIGQLYGGSSVDCSNPALDFAKYGMFNVSWNGDSDPRRRLKDWLDPDNTNSMALDGTYCASVKNITNTNFTSDTLINGCSIYIENVNIQNNANVIFDAAKATTINGPFQVNIGSTLEIR